MRRLEQPVDMRMFVLKKQKHGMQSLGGKVASRSRCAIARWTGGRAGSLTARVRIRKGAGTSIGSELRILVDYIVST